MWARHQRRLMIHRGWLAAIEKGIELPPLEQEIQKRSWNVQRLLLLAGLIWMSLGIAAYPLFVPVLATVGSSACSRGGPAWINTARFAIEGRVEALRLRTRSQARVHHDADRGHRDRPR
jgi:hypothetical protein